MINAGLAYLLFPRNPYGGVLSLGRIGKSEPGEYPIGGEDFKQLLRVPDDA
jgi:hypothetical protein